MTNFDLFAKIKDYRGKFTKAEQKVADYLMQKPQEVLYMSITDLAEKCGVGDTTVFRFCKTLHMAGYQDFKMHLAQAMTSGDSAQLTLSDEIRLTDSTSEVCRKLLSTHLSALNQTMEMLRPDDVHKAISLIESARIIHFFGMGSSAATAQEAKYKFNRVLPNVSFEPDAHMQSMTASLMGERDLAVAFSYSGATKGTIEVVKRARENHAKIICITRFAESPFAAYGDVVLLCGANEGPFQGGALSAKISQLFLVDVLYTEYFKHNYEQSDRNKKATSASIADKLL